MPDRDRLSDTLARAALRCAYCGRPVASEADWARAEANDAAGGDPEAPWAVALCWGLSNNCADVTAADRIAALEAEVARLRRERDEAHLHPETVERLRTALRVYAGKDAAGVPPHLVVSMAIGVIFDAANGWPPGSGNRLRR